ncbi:extensin family protein [Mesorhizobium sp. UC22_110]|uniref:extensin-like domain-containing protein n=1 Tax=unclassified Mesorhizobium TaxID=325217 RepID=UPI00366E06D9
MTLLKRPLAAIGITLLGTVASFDGSLASARSPKLPATAPIPEAHRRDMDEIAPISPETPAPSDVPLPQARPDKAPDKAANEQEGRKPFQGPELPSDWKRPVATKPLPDPRSNIAPAERMPAEETACRERLKTLGAEFDEAKAKHDDALGCSLPYPLMLKKLGQSVEVTPDVELDCAMAETMSRFVKDVVAPAAKAELGQELKSISQASGYVCRPRNGSSKLSEHAFGNALDIAAFTFKDGTTVEVGKTSSAPQAKLIDRIRKAACGPFKTVLGPGSDADHALHLHLDLAPRKNGGTFCQ